MDRVTDFFEKLAKAYQTYDASVIEEELADDMHYASLWVFGELTSKEDYMEYLRGKLETLKKSGTVFDFQIVNGRMHSRALLIHKVNGNVDDKCGFVVDFNDEGKVKMINITAPAFF